MNAVRVVRADSGSLVGRRVGLADSWWLRLRGLLGRRRLGRDEGLLLLECDSVHTAGMAYPIDVAFLDRSGVVLRTIAGLAPWRIGVGGRDAAHTLELAAGRLAETGTHPGVRLNWS